MAGKLALTVDLQAGWGSGGMRAVREVTARFLQFLEERGMPATFFACSWRQRRT